MTDWTHPRIENPYCRTHGHSDEIAEAARAAFQRRRDTYPQLVTAGQITADEARDDLEGWRAIAKDWRWIATGEGEPADRLTLDLRIAALDTALARWLAMVDANGGKMTEAENEQGALFCAMRIWAGREQTSPFTQHRQFFASLNHELHRRARANNQDEAA